MISCRVIALVIFMLATAWASLSLAAPVQRTLLTLYDSRYNAVPRTTLPHHFLEMPANRLGYDMQYVDVTKPLPELGADIRGIVIWFELGTEVQHFPAYITWLNQAVDKGIKIIILENIGMGSNYALNPAFVKLKNAFLKRVGVIDNGIWHSVTYDTKIVKKDPSVVEFEHRYPTPLPPYNDLHATAKVVSYLTLQENNNNSGTDHVIIGPQGGYVDAGYVNFVQSGEERELVQWYINPFTFLSLSLKQTLTPIPDVTTMVGRRIFYAHIDGDGWNNRSEISEYTSKNMISARVTQQQILEKYPDLPFTVAPVAGDLVTTCNGTEESAKAARDVLALPNVEPASHTYTHPLYWRFFEKYTPEKEAGIAKHATVKAIPKEKSRNMKEWLSQIFRSDSPATKEEDSKTPSHTAGHVPAPTNALPAVYDKTDEIMLKRYTVPRSYNCIPFEAGNEIVGSADVINKLAPSGKKAALIQWPGDTSPGEAILRLTREAGLMNINGGDGRFDSEYPSYNFVAPIGIQNGAERQIYSSTSNENVYTEQWSKNYFGFRYLKETLKRTDTPLRLLPLNVYFHIYSADKEASLSAVQENLDYARAQQVVPITATTYAKLANGFYSTRIRELSPFIWEITDRGSLQTMRFDKAEDYAVDFSMSYGVLGERHAEGSLYVALNPSVPAPIIALKKGAASASPALVQSRWNILKADIARAAITLTAQGYGAGEMEWRVPENGTYNIFVKQGAAWQPVTTATASHNKLIFTITTITAIDPIEVRIMPSNKRVGS